MKDINMQDTSLEIKDEDLLLQRVVVLMVSDEAGLQNHLRGNVQEEVLEDVLEQVAVAVERVLAEEYEGLMIDIELTTMQADKLKINITVTQGEHTLTVPKELSYA